MVIKKLDSIGLIWHAVQAPLNGCAAATTRGRGKDRITLEIVGAGNLIAMMIRSDAAWAIERDRQIDPETAIGKDGVTQDGIADSVATSYYYSGVICVTLDLSIESNDVACARLRATDRREPHSRICPPRGGLPQRLRACDIGTNDVALDDLAGPGDDV